jgi:hypothetical protein
MHKNELWVRETQKSNFASSTMCISQESFSIVYDQDGYCKFNGSESDVFEISGFLCRNKANMKCVRRTD